MMVRYPNGIDGELFLPETSAAQSRPPGSHRTTRFPSGPQCRGNRPATTRPRSRGWPISRCLELHPHPVRATILNIPDELRVDLDPVPGVTWSQVREVAKRRTRGACGSSAFRLAENVGLARDCMCWRGSNARWGFDEVRRAALALARDVERRVPQLATQQMVEGGASRRLCRLQPERQGSHRCSRVFGPTTPDATVSAPLDWDEVDHCEPGDFTLKTMPKRFAKLGDRHDGIDDMPRIARKAAGAFAASRARGLGDAPVAATLPKAGRASHHACSHRDVRPEVIR